MATETQVQREKRWEAEQDANTLAEADVIMGKARRRNAAKKAAARMAREQADRAKALKDVAGGVKLYRKMGTSKKKMGK